MRELGAHLEALSTKIDSVLDLAASSPENKDLLTDRLGRLHREKQEIERRLSELARVEQETENLRSAIKAGLQDIAWANGELARLKTDRDERRQFARLFVKKIELEPNTGDILMHLFGRPTMLAPVQTPASKETGVRIELVAGACYKAIQDALGQHLARRWRLPRNGRRIPSRPHSSQ
jgi:chaperonin cofactor prefoldin